jgi:hypothetical protein
VGCPRVCSVLQDGMLPCYCCKGLQDGGCSHVLLPRWMQVGGMRRTAVLLWLGGLCAGAVCGAFALSSDCLQF